MDFPDWYLKEKESAMLGLKNARPAKYGVDIITIKKKVPHLTKTGETDFVETINIAPKADDRIEKGDHLMVIGKDENLAKLKKLSGKE